MPELEPLTVGAMREILAHYPAAARILIDVDGDRIDLKEGHTSHGHAADATAVIFWGSTSYKLMLLSPAEQAAVEQMR